MREKREIVFQHEQIGDSNLPENTKQSLRGALNIEVQIDIRDNLGALTKAVEELAGVIDMKGVK